MSRLIIKGLPKRLEEKELRELFSFAGEVTDAKVIRTRNGVSRLFGFVGFRREADAARARKQLNGTYVQSSRVLVEVARAAGDPNIPRPWSKHSKGSSAYEKRVERQEKEEVEKRRAEARKLAKDVRERKEREKREAEKVGDIEEKDQEAFGAFKEAVSKRSRNPIWADGNVGKRGTAVAPEGSMLGESAPARKGDLVFSSDDNDDDDEEYQELPVTTEPEKPENAPVRKLKANPIALDDAVSDADYFKSKVSSAVHVGSDDSDDSDDSNSSDGSDDSESGGDEEEENEERNETDKKVENNGATTKNGTKPDSDIPASTAAEESPTPSASIAEGAAPINSQKDKSATEADAAETGRLFVRNLSYNVNEEDLEKLFEKYGTLASVHLITDPGTKRSRGVAFVLYVVPENAAKAMAALDGTIFCGRLLHVLPGDLHRGVHARCVRCRAPMSLV